MNREAYLAELDLSRRAIQRDLAVVKADLDFPGKIRESLRTQPVVWLVGAGALGLVIAFRPRRRAVGVRLVQKTGAVEGAKSGAVGAAALTILVAVIKAAMPALQPVILSGASKLVALFSKKKGSR